MLCQSSTAPQGPAALHISGGNWSLSGPVTFETVSNLEETLDKTSAQAVVISLLETSEVDSSAVALLVAIKRRYPSVQFIDVPTPLNQLADLYGVKDLLL